MIGQLKGTIIQKLPPQLLIDVMGVGYEVDAPMSTFYQLPDAGQEVLLHTHLVVREDAQLLYGFYSLAEKALFRQLIKINGVGPRLALTILSGMNANEFVLCVQDNDVAALVRLPGIGKKTAERLVIELRDKLQGDLESDSTQTSMPNTPRSASSPTSDAVSALIALGYKNTEASKMVRAVDCENVSTEEIIRLSLQAAAKK